ncbi:hypothetical protein CTAYLR_009918 [Chrysophaeum taylorii]|uniref:ABC1 atypical kinase-like domain-containing protein n=1 Tax=Chrysophaeum taylorii TaxID=2483200 RepID=A0AAD7UB33_9STRA|nr:hypothetical protein CTAYLR_009918 [Chrysophaeum taylorii]
MVVRFAPLAVVSQEWRERAYALQLVGDVSVATGASLVEHGFRRDAHLRSAQRLKRLAEKHGGLLCKFGQHVSTLHHAVPREYVEVLSSLTDAQPASDVASLVRDACPGLELEPRPIASASVAQVHRAFLPDGRVVACKVMHPGLEKKIDASLWALRCGFALASVFTKEWAWVLPEFEDALGLELDLLQEAANAERAGRVCRVPRVLWEHSSRRVLVTEFVTGHRVDDATAHRAHGIDPRRVGDALVAAVASLAYEHGLVHADPHGGNALVEPLGNGRFNLWLLDHGLYRRLDDATRRDICALWEALARGEPPEAAVRLGLGRDLEEATRVAKLLFFFSGTRRFGAEPDAVSKAKTRAQVRDLLPEASARLRALPRDLLFALRSASLLRGQHQALGGTRRDRYLIFAATAARGAALPPTDDTATPVARPARLKNPNHPLNLPTASEALQRRGVIVSLFYAAYATLRVARLRLRLLLAEFLRFARSSFLPHFS